MKLKRITSFFLTALCWIAPLSAQENRDLRIAVLSDIHVMAPGLLQEDGKAFHEYISRDRKMLTESVELLGTAVTDLLDTRPDIVLVAGDLTKDGEAVSHEYLAGKLLAPLRNAGIPVYVIPGNHDVNNPHASVFNGETSSRTKSVSPEEFAHCYNDYGYGQAIARDACSLSYAAQLNDTIRLLAIDACKYEENDYERNICVTGGRIKPETMEFIRQQVADAERHGCRVITMMHHGLVRHWKWQDKVMAEYLVDDWKSHARTFASLGLNIVFTGHFHAQDIASYGKGKKKVYDIETGSTVSYPMPYRLVTLHGKQLQISTRHIRQIPSIPAEGKLEENARQFAMSGISSLINAMLPEKVPEDIKTEAGHVLGKAYLAHLAGDEQMPGDYPEELKRACKRLRPYSWKYAFALKKLGKYLFTDLYPADNNIVLEIE